MIPKLKEKLEAARETLSTALVASHAGDKQVGQLNRSRAGVVTEIEQLEAATEANPDDEGGIARLATLRERLRLLDKKFARLQTEQLRDESPRIALDEAMQAAADLLIQSARPELDGLLREARAAFLPFYRDPARLQLAVERNDRVLSLKAYLVNAGVGLASEKPKRLLSIIDRLVAGSDCGWTWQPSPATAVPAQAPQATPAAARRTAQKLQSAMP
jgi:hypothetical protein